MVTTKMSSVQLSALQDLKYRLNCVLTLVLVTYTIFKNSKLATKNAPTSIILIKPL
jgi:hypothetical protein